MPHPTIKTLKGEMLPGDPVWKEAGGQKSGQAGPKPLYQARKQGFRGSQPWGRLEAGVCGRAAKGQLKCPQGEPILGGEGNFSREQVETKSNHTVTWRGTRAGTS